MKIYIRAEFPALLKSHERIYFSSLYFLNPQLLRAKVGNQYSKLLRKAFSDQVRLHFQYLYTEKNSVQTDFLMEISSNYINNYYLYNKSYKIKEIFNINFK